MSVIQTWQELGVGLDMLLAQVDQIPALQGTIDRMQAQIIALQETIAQLQAGNKDVPLRIWAWETPAVGDALLDRIVFPMVRVYMPDKDDHAAIMRMVDLAVDEAIARGLGNEDFCLMVQNLWYGDVTFERLVGGVWTPGPSWRLNTPSLLKHQGDWVENMPDTEYILRRGGSERHLINGWTIWDKHGRQECEAIMHLICDRLIERGGPFPKYWHQDEENEDYAQYTGGFRQLRLFDAMTKDARWDTEPLIGWDNRTAKDVWENDLGNPSYDLTVNEWHSRNRDWLRALSRLNNQQNHAAQESMFDIVRQRLAGRVDVVCSNYGSRATNSSHGLVDPGGRMEGIYWRHDAQMFAPVHYGAKKPYMEAHGFPLTVDGVRDATVQLTRESMQSEIAVTQDPLKFAPWNMPPGMILSRGDGLVLRVDERHHLDMMRLYHVELGLRQQIIWFDPAWNLDWASFWKNVEIIANEI